MSSLPMAERDDDHLASSAIQVLLAEKRTSLSMMRSGIAIIALPLTITSALIATSNFYDVHRVVFLLIAVMTVNVVLLGLGVVLVARSYRGVTGCQPDRCAGVTAQTYRVVRANERRR
jgi:uncharacterized membrane protein YidH (DUF202 family)